MPTVNSSYTRDGLNRYTAVAGASYSYDANGNLTGNGSKTFGYDVENRLTSVTGGAGLVLTYDPLGRLRQTTSGATVVQFLYDGDRLVAEYNGGGTVLRRYAHGPGIDEPLVWYEGSGLATRNFLHADERGTVIATSDNSGVGTVYSYGPYGEPNVWTGPRFKYTGQIALPEAALYHYKARVYDPAIGRFLQTDPVGYQDDLNLYAYVRNEPLNGTDFTGQCTGSRFENDDGTCEETGGFTTTSMGSLQGSERRQLESELGINNAVPDAARKVAEGASETGDVIKDVYLAEIGGKFLGGIIRLFRWGKRSGEILTAVDKLISESGQVSSSKGLLQLVRTGGFKAASRDFEAIASQSGRAVRIRQTSNGPVKILNLPNGGTMGLRNFSSGLNRPTIQIDMPGQTQVKIRYDE